MQELAVFLSTSRDESFGLAAVKAFLCGCRIEAPPALEAGRDFKNLCPVPVRKLTALRRRHFFPESSLQIARVLAALPG